MLKARMVIITYIVRLLIAAVSLSLLSCGAEESTETSPPTIDASLSATQIRQSESITMSWKASSGAVTLMPGNIALVNEGTMELKPDRSTQFVLAAKNEHGDAIKVLKLEVIQNETAPTAPKITAVFAFGSSVTLNWSPSKDDTTPPQEIVYRIYYSIDEPNSDKDQLNYIGESIGITEFAADDLPPSTRIYLYVLAVDAQSNESNLSAGEAVTTSESDPLSRTDINIFDLDETGFNYEKNGTTIVIKDSGSLSRQSRDGSLVTAQATNSISVNDAVISYNEEEPFVARVKNVSTSSDGIELEVEPISIFDLFSSGKFSFVVAGNANIDITELNYDYETDVGPLNAKVKLDFQPKLEATYEFGSQMRFTGRLFGDWNAEIATRVFGSESASLEREFPIEPLSFEVEYCSGQVNLATI